MGDQKVQTPSPEPPVYSGPSIICLPTDSERVTDADEEIFLLYTRLKSRAPDDAIIGLGSVNSKLSEITVTFDIQPCPSNQTKHAYPQEKTLPKGGRPRRKPSIRRSPGSAEKLSEVVEYVLEQDPSSLRSRKGDTGSVLWRASVLFGKWLLSDIVFPPADPNRPFLSRLQLEAVRVLELGAGIGLLGSILSPYVRHYVATDIAAMIPLLRKNLIGRASIASNLTVTDVDWVELHEASESRRQKAFPPQDIDLILCCDCIYNVALVPPLVTTINHYSRKHVPVVIVVELREEDVLREFLDAWLSSGDWEIWRIGAEDKLGVRTVAWAGWLRC